MPPQGTLPPEATPPAEWKSAFDNFRTVGDERNDRPIHTPLSNYFWLVLGATVAGALMGAGLFILALTHSNGLEEDTLLTSSYDQLVSLLQGATLAGAGLGLVADLACCIHWRGMQAREIRKLRNRAKTRAQ